MAQKSSVRDSIVSLTTEAVYIEQSAESLPPQVGAGQIQLETRNGSGEPFVHFWGFLLSTFGDGLKLEGRRENFRGNRTTTGSALLAVRELVIFKFRTSRASLMRDSPAKTGLVKLVGAVYFWGT
jgi:hypothetical protein